jgi:hypothetical protein
MSIEGTGLTPDSPKSSSSGGEWVDVSGRGQGDVANESVAPRGQTPQGASKSTRDAVQRLTKQWQANDPNALQAKYEAENGSPDIQAAEAPPIERPAQVKPSTPELDRIKAKYAGKGIQGGDKEMAESLRGRKTMTPEGEVNSARDAASIAYGKKSIAAANAAEPDIEARNKYFANKTAGIEKEYQADKDYVAQVAQDRDVWFEDVKKNSKDATSSFGIKNAFVGYRQDAPMPEADIDGVAARRKSDPNYKPERYKSQYESKDITDTYGVTRKSETFTGETKTTPIPGLPDVVKSLFGGTKETDKRALKLFELRFDLESKLKSPPVARLPL